MINEGRYCKGCYNLPYGNVRVEAEGDGSSGIMLLGDSIWREEAIARRPFVGASGQLLNRILKRLSIDRSTLIVSNSMQCFRSPETHIYTPEGYKYLKFIQVGDLVLTHTGTFKNVTAIIRIRGRNRNTDYVQIGPRNGGVIVTPDHRFMTPTGWKYAADLQNRVEVIVLAHKCELCGAAFYKPFVDRRWGRFCSRRCHGIYAVNINKEGLRASLLESYVSGSRNRFTVTEAANKAWRLALASGFRPQRTKEGLENQRIKAAITRQVIASAGESDMPWVGFGEEGLADILRSVGIEYIPQYAIDGYNFDFAIGNTLVEVDGPGSKNVVRKEATKIKDALALTKGFKVVHIPCDKTESILEILRNDSHDFSFIPVYMDKIMLKGRDQGAWSLAVEGDESMISRGLVSHNCQPPHLGWTDHPHRYPEAISALRQCEPYLQDTLNDKKPRVIVALGNVAMRQAANLNIAADITQRHAYVHESQYGIPVIPTFHPSFLLQGRHKLEICLMFALRRAQEVADGSYRESRYNLLLDPPIDAGYRYLNDHLRASANGRINLLMVDIETPESSNLDEEDLEEKGLSYHIDRAGFSLDDHSGISFPFKQPYIDLLQAALSKADMVSEWADNHFDSKRLRAAGVTTQGRWMSGMYCWHFYQSDLLKGLGFVAPFFYSGGPFKHLASSQPALYNALDNYVGRLCTVGSMDKLRSEGRLDRFMRHCVDVDRIYVKMGSTGVMLDTDHHGKFISRLKGEYEQQVMDLQPLVKDEVKPVKLWKKQPSDMTGVIELPLPSMVIDGKTAKEMIAAAKGTVTDAQFKAAKKKINELRNPYRYKKILPFNPGSPLQMKALIRSLGLKVPHNRDGETTGAKHLKRFTKYPIFHQILIAKERGHMVSAYNWKVNDEGRITTQYGYHPSTWRKSSRNFALMTIPKRMDLANEFRKSIVAAPGHYFVTSDAAAIEAVLVGYDAGSESYIRLAKAGLHGWMTSAYHGKPIPLDIPFEQLTKLCKSAKKEWPTDYETLKRIGHL